MNAFGRLLVAGLVLVGTSLGPRPADAAMPSPAAVTAIAPAAAAAATMVVRAYFFLGDGATGGPSLVPVLRTVPRSLAVASAAMRELLAGPSATERTASPRISTAIPAGTRLLGVQISRSIATVNLTPSFASGGGSFSVRGRLAQVVYTLTQFPTVTSVRFQLNGRLVTVFSSEGLVLNGPIGRAGFRDDFLAAIFADRPAYGAAIGNPARITGLANVFEAQFRAAILDRRGHVLVERAVTASCGTGCWGTFALSLSYRVSGSQWGALRVWDNSARDGRPVDVRTYPVWLTPGR
jgi:germination protein M